MVKESQKQAVTRGRRVTMEAVGRIAGVSQVTVSRALSDPSRVSPETLQRIRDAIEATGFVPNALAGALASQRSNLVTALIPSITNITYSAFIRTFSQKMRRAGYQILLSETGFDEFEEEALITAHLSRRPDAMLLTGIHHTAQAKRQLLGAAIPVVEIWDITDTPIDLCVGFSHSMAGRAVADHLFSAGYRSAATVTASDQRARRRRDAFAEHFSTLAGMQAVPDDDSQGAARIGAGRAGLSKLLGSGEFTSGVVFCSSDLIAQGVMIEARSRGLRVPEDIAVVGFGDQEFARDLDPPLTTVRVDRDQLGNVAAEALLARISGKRPPDSVNDIGFQIISRGSA